MLVKKLPLNWVKNTLIIGTACASLNVLAGEATVWSDSAGDVVTDGAGDCLHTIWWKKGTDCGNEPEVKAMPAPVEKSEPVVEKTPEPQPEFEPFSLSSSAAFALSGSTLSPEGKAAVKEFAEKLEGHQVDKIIVEGYTDNTGAASFNQALSEKRANAVKEEMINNGIDANLITAVGHGEDDPVADNSTREGRATNRRVKVTVEGVREVH